MNKLDIAARQALEALEELFHSNSTKVAVEKYNTAHTALREALAELNCQCGDKCFPIFSGNTEYCETCGKPTLLAEQAEQEPVGVVEDSGEWGIAGVLVAGVPIGTKLYAAPVRTKDLTDDEIEAVVNAEDSKHILRDATELEIARAVIAADREKNK